MKWLLPLLLAVQGDLIAFQRRILKEVNIII
jgi:hypothetical protein